MNVSKKLLIPILCVVLLGGTAKAHKLLALGSAVFTFGAVENYYLKDKKVKDATEFRDSCVRIEEFRRDDSAVDFVNELTKEVFQERFKALCWAGGSLVTTFVFAPISFRSLLFKGGCYERF